ncbi:PaaI family thioesterase [Desulfatiglans anilini]|uniref:PaaI family thioesterase n=1 Tax=Desulfatiglans anilini TaxID=90728 RepID=UPI0003FE716C|nr:hotdog fold thioesterase [Desulfatiglans anilini]
MALRESIRSAMFARVREEGYADKLGLRLVDVEEGYAKVEMKPDTTNENIFGMVHGGAIFSLMDEAFQISCNSHGTVAVALSVSVVYHRPPEAGATLTAESREVHRSAKTGTYDIHVRDEKDRLIASCQALAYRKKDRLPFLPVGDA